MQKTQTTCLIILTTIAVGFSLHALQTVLLPFVIAVFIVIGCKPIIEFLEQRKAPKIVAFGLTFFAGALSFLALCYLVLLSIHQLSQNTENYEDRLNAIAIWLERFLEEEAASESDQSEPLPTQPVEAQENVDGSIIETTNEEPENVESPLGRFLESTTNYLQSFMLNLLSSLSSLLSYAVLVLIFVYFLLFGGSTISKQPQFISEIEEQIRKFLVIKTVISALTGFIFGLILWLFGVPLAIVFGVLAFLLNYIPNIGPLVAIVLPIPFLVLSSTMSPTAAICCFVLISAVEFISGNVVETNLMGKSFDVSPVVLLLALMLFGLVWGIVGMFLATPLVSIAKIILERTPHAKFLAELIAGRWGASDPNDQIEKSFA